MIKLNLKRIEDNQSVTFGILSISLFNFKCMTLELKDGTGCSYMHNCRIPEGIYTLVPGFAMNHSMYPLFKYKLSGFAKKPNFNIQDFEYSELPTGDIALGDSKLNDFAIHQSKDVCDKFCEVMRNAFTSKEQVVLQVFKKKNFVHTDYSYKDMMADLSENMFVEDDEDEEPPVTDDGKCI